MDGRDRTALRDKAARVKAAATMEDVLKGRGFPTTRNRRIPCPMHNGKDPNFSYHDNKHYRCFVCGAKGTVIDFVAWADGLTVTKAIQKLAAEYGIGDPLDYATSAGQRLAAERVAKQEREKAYRIERDKLLIKIAGAMRIAIRALDNGPPWTGEQELAIREFARLDNAENELTGESWKETVAGEEGEIIREICDKIGTDTAGPEYPDFVPMNPTDNPGADPWAGAYSGKGWIEIHGGRNE